MLESVEVGGVLKVDNFINDSIMQNESKFTNDGSKD